MIHAELSTIVKANKKIAHMALKLQKYYKALEIGITLLAQTSFYDAILNSKKHCTKPYEL